VRGKSFRGESKEEGLGQTSGLLIQGTLRVKGSISSTYWGGMRGKLRKTGWIRREKVSLKPERGSETWIGKGKSRGLGWKISRRM